MALLEWSNQLGDLVPVSLHGYESIQGLTPSTNLLPSRRVLSVDPLSRCATLLLPTEYNPSLAILPFFQDPTDEVAAASTLPYAFSFLLQLTSVHPTIKYVIDHAFLQGFNEPTMAVLYATQPSTAARIDVAGERDSVSLIVITLDLSGSTNPTHAVISHIQAGLPYDAHSVHACPKELGNVLVCTGNAIIHVNQSGKLTGTAVNAWHRTTSSIPLPMMDVTDLSPASLDNSSLAFMSPYDALLWLGDGTVYTVHFRRDGRTLSSITIAPQPTAQGTVPSCVEVVNREFVYVASAIGPGTLLRYRAGHVSRQLTNGSVSHAMDIDGLESKAELDDDLDLYDTSAQTNGLVKAEVNGMQESQSDDILTCVDTLDAYGPIRQMTVGMVALDEQPELIACTGGLQNGGLTVFHRGINPHKRRKVDAELGGATRLAFDTTGSFTTIYAGLQAHTIITSSDMPGMQDTTMPLAAEVIASSTSFPGFACVQVMTDKILYSSMDDPGSLHTIDIEDGLVEHAQICAPFILLRQADATYKIFRDEGESLVEVATRAFGKPVASAHIVVDYRGALRSKAAAGRQQKKEEGSHDQYLLVTCTASGILQIWTLSDDNLFFTNASLLYLPPYLHAGPETAAEPFPPEDSEIEQILISPVGGRHAKLHLAVLLQEGTLAVYSVEPDFQSTTDVSFYFSKLHQQEIPNRPIADAAVQMDLLRMSSTSLANGRGIFVTGSAPHWIAGSDHGPAHIYEVQWKPVLALHTPSSSSNLVFIADQEGLHLAEVADACYDQRLPWTPLNAGQAYTDIVYNRSGEAYVAAAVYATPFVLFDEETAVWEPKDPALARPQSFSLRSCLHLILPSSWEIVHGYEFRQNEAVISIKSMTLESKSSVSGYKEFIGVGTDVNTGEDNSVRGALYIFEVVKVVDDGDGTQHNRHLNLLYTEDFKHSVTNVCDINGYLVHSMGLKLYIKAFDNDERLLAIAFLDIGAYTTSIRVLKNFLLLGDVVRGVTFIAFQEEPFRLVPLGRDMRKHGSISADFLVHEGKVSFITTDRAGVLRVLEYNPLSIESRAGERLLCRTEFQMATEIATTLLYSKRAGKDDASKQSGLLISGTDGSLNAVAPLRDATAKRLQLLERQLFRHSSSFSGLNPRSFRTVRNDYVSRALSKGILDGLILGRYPLLHSLRQAEMAKSASSTADTLRFNIQSLKGPW